MSYEVVILSIEIAECFKQNHVFQIFFMFACEISSACYSWNQQESVVGRLAENIRPPTPIPPYVSYLNKTLNF